jgi:hypothetical protein
MQFMLAIARLAGVLTPDTLGWRQYAWDPGIG